MFDFYVNIKLRDLLTKIKDQYITISCGHDFIYIGMCPIIGDIPNDIYVVDIFAQIRNSTPTIHIKVNKVFTIAR